MSITLITGVPGSGKTLKAVWDHVRPMVGHVDHAVDEWGRQKDIPSIIYTNINSLQIDHELIEGGGTWQQIKDKASASPPVGDIATHTLIGDNLWHYHGNAEGLRNWHNWAKPGAKVVFDEFQKFWPPRPNGSAIPPDIQTLDTHRHMGVDFILITQNCRNVDRHILGLVDRHLHVRRVANMPLATVYEWDHASVSLQYKNSMSKSPWRYPKAAYKLYKSAELHTKQSRKLPAVLWFILAGLAGAAYAIPSTINRIAHRSDPVKIAKQEPVAATGQPTTKTYINENGQEVTIETTTRTEIAPLAALAASAPMASAAGSSVEVAGCIVVGPRCSCFSTQGKKVDMAADYCIENSAAQVLVPKQVVPDTPVPRSAAQGDLEALQFLHRKT